MATGGRGAEANDAKRPQPGADDFHHLSPSLYRLLVYPDLG